ncbi:MAG TPA: TonB-dependent receptor, partial [Terriglobales bacterium]|nr:TonB-dependent receptor [Terriglobales bacterium]
QQELKNIPAAVYVITQEEIRRSGAASIPDLLRLVPGAEVAQIDNNTWAISIRGFNSMSNNKLLVLIDGRSVYYPTYSNVFWNVQDVVLEDVQRVEVIRGPGASLWGSNAVNGVINIVTKNAKDTEGTLVTAGGGTFDQAFGSARYGGRLGSAGYYRVFGKYSLRDNVVDLPLDGRAQMTHGGFRADWNLGKPNFFTFQGDLYREASPQAGYLSVFTRQPVITRQLHASGGNLLSRWTHRLGGGSETALQVYYTRSQHPDVLLDQFHEVLDVDFQHHLPIERHDLLWGGGFRYTRQDSQGSSQLSLVPAGRDLRLFSAFLQDEIKLFPGRLAMTAGARLENNDYSGFELQPTLRFMWTPHPRHSAWAAVSRAVRLPAIWDNAASMRMWAPPLPDQTPVLATLSSNVDSRSEKVIAYELGYRVQPAKDFSLDVAGFWQHYDHLCGLLQTAPFPALSPPPPHLVVPHQVTNLMFGNNYGLEVTSAYTPNSFWKLTGSYSFLRQITGGPSSLTLFSFPGEDNDNPRHQFQTHSYLTLPYNLEADTALYYVGALPGQAVGNYARLDMRLGWRPARDLEFSIVGQRLTETPHYEFQPFWEYVVSGKRGREFYGKVTWRF